MRTAPFQKAVWGIALVFSLLLPSAGLAGPHGSRKQDKVDSALRDRLRFGAAQPVIVRAKPGHRASVRNKVAAHTESYREHKSIDAFSARLTPGQIRALAHDSDVDGVSYDADIVGFASTPAGTVDTASIVKQMVGVGDWFPGSSMAIAVIDSGIAPSADFDTRILGMYNFTNGAPGILTAPYDDYGHGTHVAGLIGSNGSSSNGKYAGVAPGVKFLALKVLDKKGSGRTSDVISALEFVVANKSTFGVRVVNLSLGHPIYESAKTDPLVIAVENAVRAGLVVVVAAGNYGTNPNTGLTGYAGIASPGNAPSAITVGAANTNGTVDRSDDRLAPYSSRGPSWYDGIAKPDVLAPGQALVSADASGSTLETSYPGLVIKSGNSKYLKLSGSSMATAVVSGMVVMAIEANASGALKRWQDYQITLKKSQRTTFVPPPELTSNAIKAMLQFSATPIHDEYDVSYGPLQQGTGMVNGLGLIYFAYYSDTTKSPGEYWMTLTGYPYSSYYGATNMAWSQSIIWGTRILAGTSVTDVNQYGWAANVVWGTGEDGNVVSGTADDDGNVVWGTAADDEGNVVWGTTIPTSLDLTWSGNATWTNNVVWGTAAEDWEANVVWGTGLVGYFNGSSVMWGASAEEDGNVVWGTLNDGDDDLWGASADKVTALGVEGGAL
jgi:serine protease AprX